MDEDLELLFVTTEDLLDATKHNMRLETGPESPGWVEGFP